MQDRWHQAGKYGWVACGLNVCVHMCVQPASGLKCQTHARRARCHRPGQCGGLASNNSMSAALLACRTGSELPGRAEQASMLQQTDSLLHVNFTRLTQPGRTPHLLGRESLCPWARGSPECHSAMPAPVVPHSQGTMGHFIQPHLLSLCLGIERAAAWCHR